jgi:hypothetical protein
MSSTPSPTQSGFSAGPRPTKASVDATPVPADPKNDRIAIKQLSLGERTSLAIVFLISFGTVVAAVLASRSSREMIAVQQAESVPQTAPDVTAPVAPATSSSDLERQLEAVSLGLVAVRQSVDQLAAGQEQMKRDIADILDKMSAPPPRPAAAAARKPVPVAPAPSAR